MKISTGRYARAVDPNVHRAWFGVLSISRVGTGKALTSEEISVNRMKLLTHMKATGINRDQYAASTTSVVILQYRIKQISILIIRWNLFAPRQLFCAFSR